MSTTFGQFFTALIKKEVVRTDEEVVTNHKKSFFIQLNRLSSDYKGSLKFLKAVLFSMYGSAYPSHFGNARRNQIIK